MVRRGVVWALALAVVVLAELPVAWHYLVAWPQDQWQVDVEVYREAGRSVLVGRPVYLHLTESPQLLPFTYPPFAALLAVPLALMPFGVAGWLWTAAQVAAVVATVAIAFRPWLVRAAEGLRARYAGGAGGREWLPLLVALVSAPMLWLHPVADGVRFGQVNAFIVLACLADIALPRTRWPRGLLIGLCVAVKLTPGVFLIHFLLSRRWREAAWVVGGAAGATVGALLVLPEASLAFWGGALSDPTRLGPNAGTSNQSLRGVLLRLGPDGVAGSLLWLVLVAVVGWAGFLVARRAHAAGLRAAEVGAVGLMAVLLSPVAWIHHLAWMVVVIGALVGSGRSRRHLAYAAVMTGWFLCRLPWWGITWIDERWQPRAVGRLLQNADCLGALLALLLLWLVVRSRAPRADGDVTVPARPVVVPAEPAARPSA